MSAHVRTIGRHARQSLPFSAVFASIAFGLEHVIPGAWLLLAFFGLKIVSGTVLHTVGARHSSHETTAATVGDVVVSAAIAAVCVHEIGANR